MKKLRKALVCVALLCCLSVSALGCSSTDSNNNPAENSVSDSVQDTQSSDEAQETDAQGNAVTDAQGSDNNAQETVALTDSNGNVVTDADGNVVTQVVVDNNNNKNNNDDSNSSTTTAKDGQTTDSKGNTVTNNSDNNNNNSNNNDNNNNSNNNNNNSNNNNNNSNNNNNNNSNSNDNNNNNNNNNSNVYFAKSRYATFLWMSEDTSNKVESGAMVELSVKVLDDAKAGDYPIEFNYVELYNSDNDEVPFTVQNGTVTVGKALSVTEQGAATSGVNYRLDNATAQPGDVVKLKVHLDNNTGIAVTRVELKYDNKALEVQSINACGVFADQIIENGKLNSDTPLPRS